MTESVQMPRRKRLSWQTQMQTIPAWSRACSSSISGSGGRRVTLQMLLPSSPRTGRAGEPVANTAGGGSTSAVGRQLCVPGR